MRDYLDRLVFWAVAFGPSVVSFGDLELDPLVFLKSLFLGQVSVTNRMQAQPFSAFGNRGCAGNLYSLFGRDRVRADNNERFLSFLFFGRHGSYLVAPHTHLFERQR